MLIQSVINLHLLFYTLVCRFCDLLLAFHLWFERSASFAKFDLKTDCKLAEIMNLIVFSGSFNSIYCICADV